jgi:hypothetical protein
LSINEERRSAMRDQNARRHAIRLAPRIPSRSNRSNDHHCAGTLDHLEDGALAVGLARPLRRAQVQRHARLLRGALRARVAARREPVDDELVLVAAGERVLERTRPFLFVVRETRSLMRRVMLYD